MGETSLIEEGSSQMARITDIHKRWMKNPKHRWAYVSLEKEFVVAAATGSRLRIVFETKKVSART
jgi:hypothetical protein